MLNRIPGDEGAELLQRPLERRYPGQVFSREAMGELSVREQTAHGNRKRDVQPAGEHGEDHV